MCIETWVRGAYGSYCVKNPHENQVLGYNALVSNDASLFNFTCGYVDR